MSIHADRFFSRQNSKQRILPFRLPRVTRLLLERDAQGGIQAIPPTLQQSLTARLDRLGPAREVAQVAAVIGRGFSYALLAAVAAMKDKPLQTALERLADADILLVQGLPPESDYHFKHALIQDAAYENLLKSRRQVLHRRVAEILRDRFPDTAGGQPEALAYHFTQAGLTDAAIEWWGKAGDQALRRSAFQEAISHLGRAIEMAGVLMRMLRVAQPLQPVRGLSFRRTTAWPWHGPEASQPRKRPLPSPVRTNSAQVPTTRTSDSLRSMDNGSICALRPSSTARSLSARC